MHKSNEKRIVEDCESSGGILRIFPDSNHSSKIPNNLSSGGNMQHVSKVRYRQCSYHESGNGDKSAEINPDLSFDSTSLNEGYSAGPCALYVTPNGSTDACYRYTMQKMYIRSNSTCKYQLAKCTRVMPEYPTPDMGYVLVPTKDNSVTVDSSQDIPLNQDNCDVISIGSQSSSEAEEFGEEGEYVEEEGVVEVEGEEEEGDREYVIQDYGNYQAYYDETTPSASSSSPIYYPGFNDPNALDSFYLDNQSMVGYSEPGSEIMPYDNDYLFENPDYMDEEYQDEDVISISSNSSCDDISEGSFANSAQQAMSPDNYVNDIQIRNYEEEITNSGAIEETTSLLATRELENASTSNDLMYPYSTEPLYSTVEVPQISPVLGNADDPIKIEADYNSASTSSNAAIDNTVPEKSHEIDHTYSLISKFQPKPEPLGNEVNAVVEPVGESGRCISDVVLEVKVEMDADQPTEVTSTSQITNSSEADTTCVATSGDTSTQERIQDESDVKVEESESESDESDLDTSSDSISDGEKDTQDTNPDEIIIIEGNERFIISEINSNSPTMSKSQVGEPVSESCIISLSRKDICKLKHTFKQILNNCDSPNVKSTDDESSQNEITSPMKVALSKSSKSRRSIEPPVRALSRNEAVLDDGDSSLTIEQQIIYDHSQHSTDDVESYVKLPTRCRSIFGDVSELEAEIGSSADDVHDTPIDVTYVDTTRISLLDYQTGEENGAKSPRKSYSSYESSCESSDKSNESDVPVFLSQQTTLAKPNKPNTRGNKRTPISSRDSDVSEWEPDEEEIRGHLTKSGSSLSDLSGGGKLPNGKVRRKSKRLSTKTMKKRSYTRNKVTTSDHVSSPILVSKSRYGETELSDTDDSFSDEDVYIPNKESKRLDISSRKRSRGRLAKKNDINYEEVSDDECKTPCKKIKKIKKRQLAKSYLYNLELPLVDQSAIFETLQASVVGNVDNVKDNLGTHLNNDPPTMDQAKKAEHGKHSDLDCLLEVFNNPRRIGRFSLSLPNKQPKDAEVMATQPKPNYAKEHSEKRRYCICQKYYNFNSFYIGCDYCNEWYHGECINITESMSELIDKYVCRKCVAKEHPRDRICKCLFFSKATEPKKVLGNTYSNRRVAYCQDCSLAEK